MNKTERIKEIREMVITGDVPNETGTNKYCKIPRDHFITREELEVLMQDVTYPGGNTIEECLFDIKRFGGEKALQEITAKLEKLKLEREKAQKY